MNRSMSTIPVFALVLSVFAPVPAAVVHKWVDSDGITHYSDEIPASALTPVTRIELPEAPASTDGKASGEYSIANQWRRMHQERLQREKLALEKARQKARQQQATEVVYVERPEETRYVVTYPRSRYRQHGYYRSHYKHGSRNARMNKKSIHGFQRAGRQQSRSSLGYFKHIQ